MNLETIKQYVEQHLMLITNLGTVAIALTTIGINNRVNNGGVFTFKNPNNAIVQEVNNEVVRVADVDKNAKAKVITNKYKQDNFIDGTNFNDNVADITINSGNKLAEAFVAKMKKFDVNNKKLKELSGDIEYGNMIGENMPYENVENFIKVVDRIRDNEIEGIVAEVDLSKIDLNNGKFAVKDNKITLKPEKVS